MHKPGKPKHRPQLKQGKPQHKSARAEQPKPAQGKPSLQGIANKIGSIMTSREIPSLDALNRLLEDTKKRTAGSGLKGAELKKELAYLTTPIYKAMGDAISRVIYTSKQAAGSLSISALIQLQSKVRDLRISGWTGERLDRQIAEEINSFDFKNAEHAHSEIERLSESGEATVGDFLMLKNAIIRSRSLGGEKSPALSAVQQQIEAVTMRGVRTRHNLKNPKPEFSLLRTLKGRRLLK